MSMLYLLDFSSHCHGEGDLFVAYKTLIISIWYITQLNVVEFNERMLPSIMFIQCISYRLFKQPVH